MGKPIDAGQHGTIEITLFGFLVSLTLKAALDTAYGHLIPTVTSAVDLVFALWIPASLLVIVFLVTLLRFVYGAYRFHEEFQEASTNLKPWAQLWNIAATLVLFVIFYLTGLSIQHSQPFYVGLIVVHLWDCIWFVTIVVWTDNLTASLKTTMRKFIVIDVVTVGLLALTLLLFGTKYRGKAAIIMLVLAIVDFYWNRKFFFNPTAWRATQTVRGIAMVSKRIIYFAGPLFTQAEWLWNSQLADRLSGFNFEVILPQLRAEPMLLKEEAFDPRALFHANVQGINKADVVLAVLDQSDADSGTCWECGYAYKAGKPIIGLRTDIRNGADDPSGVNLMLFHSCAKFLLLPMEKRSDIDWVAVRVSELVDHLK